LLGSNGRVPRTQLVASVAVVVLLGFLFTVQVRSAATAQRYLDQQDGVTLGLLITGLSQANNRLVLQRVDLSQREQRLAQDLASPAPDAPALKQELSRLQIVNGTLPVHGPGVQLTVGFKLQSFEMQDLTNAFRQLGTEALSINGRRITARTVFADRNGDLAIDGGRVQAPYTVLAIGDPTAISIGAQDLVASLQPRGTVSLQQLAGVHITATAPERPIVYSSFRE
jgi:uncharacterized protein YlxW (UPF0749 family)